MSEINGTFRNGHVELDSSVDWPNGARVTVVPAPNHATSPRSNGSADDPSWGIDEADYEDTPEFRAKLIAQMDSFEPLELTPAEEAEWQAALKWFGDYTLQAVKRDMGLQGCRLFGARD
jgi:hypothetical protein